ncbi:hypothetical protein ACET3Z_000442 [Daucus carota]
MKVEILSTELIKPYTSTPLSLRHYNISLVDELSPAMNVPTILYYPAEENVTTNSICMHLKKSLSMALARFYPLAGRYMKESFMVDCSDQGAEFVQAQVDIRLDQLIGLGKNVQAELLNCLLPRPVGACDEDTDPLVAVQVSAFACGGYAMGILSSHSIADMSTTSSFVMEWAREAKRLLEGLDHDQDHEFPGRPRGFLVSQTVNMRERTDPPISKKQCGNLYLVASARSVAGATGVELESIVELLTDSVRRELANCEQIVPIKGEKNKMMITQGFNEVAKSFADPEISSIVMFTDWCKFPLYEADFGWGKPSWVSSVHVPLRNMIYLLCDKSGEGIEAWVNLSVDDMPKFEQDANIVEFTS